MLKNLSTTYDLKSAANKNAVNKNAIKNFLARRYFIINNLIFNQNYE